MDIAVLRRCRRCDQWRSIEVFQTLAKLCRRCASSNRQPVDRIQAARGMALTAKGRAALRDLAAA